MFGKIFTETQAKNRKYRNARNLILPKSINTIGVYAFHDCYNIVIL